MNDSIVVARRPRSSAAERAQWAQQFLQSGLTQQEFALRHGLRLTTLHRWVKQQGHTSQSVSPVEAGFVEVKLPPPSQPLPRWSAELLRPDGTTLRLAQDVGPVLLRHLLRAC